jgi:hypothetical protein
MAYVKVDLKEIRCERVYCIDLAEEEPSSRTIFTPLWTFWFQKMREIKNTIWASIRSWRRTLVSEVNYFMFDKML